MGRGEKRSFDQVEPSVDEYTYSESDHCNLTKLAVECPPFCFRNLDIDTKMASLKVSPSVVSLVSFSGEVVVSQGSGTIIEVEENTNIVLTSLNLLRNTKVGTTFSLAENSKIVIRSSDKISYIGEIYAYDFHYNLLIIKFKSKAPLQPAKLGTISDDVGPGSRSFLRADVAKKVKPGDPVIVVGRYFYKPFNIMAAPGIFSMDHFVPSEYDCRELLSSTCRFTKCGDGGPIINISGEVIGIAYFEFSETSPFLPIHIPCKWWDHYKRNSELRHPCYGFEAINLHLTALPVLERVLTSLPGISNGVLVKKVVSESNADSAGLREEDVITKCDGKRVSGFFELWNFLWEKTGDVVELEVARAVDCTIQTFKMDVGEATPNQLNNWPIHILH